MNDHFGHKKAKKDTKTLMKYAHFFTH